MAISQGSASREVRRSPPDESLLMVMGPANSYSYRINWANSSDSVPIRSGAVGTHFIVLFPIFFRRVNTVRLIHLCLLLVASIPQQGFAQQYVNLLENDLQHWMKTSGDSPGKGWELESNGILHMTGGGGNLVTREEYGDFELWFEFRISEKENSGIKYRVRQYDNKWLGLEYQILDDSGFARLARKNKTASLYDLVEPIPVTTKLNPVGQFNVCKIRVQGHRTQHWINGQITVQERLVGDQWKAHVAQSKFKKQANFGENALGRIMLTDHKSEVWLRNVFVRRLGTASCCPVTVGSLPDSAEFASR